VREVVIKMEEESKPERVMKLTNRDLEILKFVLEMKFVSIEDVYHRFFKVKKNGELSKSDWWTRDRVYQLQKHGFLRKLSFYTEARWFYVATEKAYNLLLGKYTGLHFCDPTRKIDIHTFHHDWLVTKCRIELESRGAG
jgi:Fe2+ or Zn2+ uptake regulation protein